MSLNPLLWLHLRITGSARTNVLIVTAYAATIILFASISFYVAALNVLPRDRTAVFAQMNGAWLVIVTVAQGVFLLLLGPSAVRRAVQRDFDTGMLDSHRLSPMSNLKIVLGYLTGSPIQAVLLYAVSLVFGTYFAASYAASSGLGGAIGVRATLAGWYFAQGCMLMLAAMFAALILLTALATRGKANVVGILALIGVFGGWFASVFVPGLALVLGVRSGGVLFGLLTSTKIAGDALTIVNAGALQFTLCLIFVTAACGKLRKPERPLFSLRLGLTLLIVWGIALLAGMHAAPDYDWLFGEWREYRFAQLVASTIAFMLVSLLPLAAAAINLFHHDRAASFGERPVGRSRLLLLAPLLAALTVSCLDLMLRAVGPHQLSRAAREALLYRSVWAGIAAALLLSFWTDFHCLYSLKALVRRPTIAFLIVLAVLKGAPLAIDGVVKFCVEEVAEQAWTGQGYLTGLSPIGTLLLIPRAGAPVWFGLVFQLAVAVGATALARRARRRLSQHRVAQDA